MSGCQTSLMVRRLHHFHYYANGPVNRKTAYKARRNSDPTDSWGEATFADETQRVLAHYSALATNNYQQA